MKKTTLLKVTMVTALILSLLVSCGRKSENVAKPAVDAFAKVREKLKSFENGELTLDEVTSTGPDEADAKWVHSLVGFYLSHSNEVTVKMKLPISRCLGVMGKYPEAIQLAQDYVSVYPNDWHGWRILGRANYELENFNTAVNAYTNAVRLGDVSSCDVLAVTALKANRLDAFSLTVPELLQQKDSPQAEYGWRLEIAMLLAVYAIRTDQKEVFVKAVSGLEEADILTRPDFTSVVKLGCAQFKAQETEALCNQLAE